MAPLEAYNQRMVRASLPLGSVSLLGVLAACTTLPRAPAEQSPSISASPPRTSRGRGERIFQVELHFGPVLTSLADGHGARLYFTESHGGPRRDELWTVPKRGGTAVRLVGEVDFESAPVVDGEFAYYLGEAGAVRRARLDDGAIITLAAPSEIDAAVPNQTPRDPRYDPRAYRRSRSELLPPAIVFDDEFVYWFDEPTESLMRVAKTGSAPVALARGLAGPPRHLTLDDAYLYFESRGSLVRLAKSTPGPPETLPASLDDSSAYGVTAGNVVWLQSRRWFSLSAAGAPVPFDLAKMPSNAEKLLVRGDVVFYIVHRPMEYHNNYTQTDLVGSVSLRTGALRVLSAGQVEVDGLVADDEAVYFLELGVEKSVKDWTRRIRCCSIWRAER